jgi:hypothetical protein
VNITKLPKHKDNRYGWTQNPAVRAWETGPILSNQDFAEVTLGAPATAAVVQSGLANR